MEYSIPLFKDRSNGLMPWIFGFMTYIAVLMLASGFTVGQSAQSWKSDLTGRATLILPSAEEPSLTLEARRERKRRAQLLIADLKLISGIESAEPVSAETLSKLLEPWLGSLAGTRGLPVPDLIDIQLKDSSPQVLEETRARIRAFLPEAKLDDHHIWRAKLTRLAKAVQLVTFLTIALVIATAAVMMAFAVKSAMAAYSGVIELLHLFGARDEYIVRQFLSYSFQVSRKGSAAGFVFGAATLFFIRHSVSSGDPILLSALHLNLGHWAALILLPFVFSLLAALTANVTVRLNLLRF